MTSLLSSKQISIIDEIRQPQSRWSYVRENDMFMEIVKNIREEQDAAVENTMTQSAPSQTQTKTPAIQPMAQTAKNDEVEFEVFADDMTPTPVPSAVPQTMPTPVGMKDVTAPTERIPNSHHLPPSMIKNYGAPTDLRLKNQIQKTSSSWRGIVFGLTAIAIVAVAVTFLWNDSKKSLGYEELLNRAIRYKSLGLYDLSLQAYKRASAMKEPDADSQIQMAPVLISEDRQSLQGRRILERALTQEGRSREEQLDAYMGISVSYMMDGDLKEAENSLQKAIGRDPANFSALLNLAIVQMKKGNYLEAMRHFESIYRKNTKSVIALFGRAMSAVEYAKTVTDRSFLKPLITDLEVGTKATGHLRQELSLFIVYAHSLLGDVDGVNQAVVQFLDFESGIADRYTHPLFVD
ncbi:MAG TPA: tetratricopeptide repeat protein, partial [Bdellovibrio sp.]|nr:tetratricopeptide repeat protein [Bdellovibrio sp.]